VGGLAFILPHLELDAVWAPMDTDAGDHASISLFDIAKKGDPFWARTNAWTMAQTKIGTFVCPSDLPYNKLMPFVTLNLYQNSPTTATMQGTMVGGGNVLGRTNYLGVAGFAGHIGLPDFDHYQGVFYNRSKTDFRDITDGASNTLLFGECMGSDSYASSLSFSSYAWIGAGAMCTGYGLSQSPTWSQFSSYHPGIVNFCLADGSVREISLQIDSATFTRLGAIADGQITSPPP